MILIQDPRTRSIQWKDLTGLTTRQRIVENPITIPWYPKQYIAGISNKMPAEFVI